MPERAHRPGVQSSLAATAAILLALLAITGAYATLSKSQRNPEQQAVARSPQVALIGALPVETWADGFEGQWIGDDATLAIRDPGRFWFAFRAASFKRQRVLRLVGAGADDLRVLIRTRMRSGIVGPIRSSGYRFLRLVPEPGASRVSRLDDRTLAVFISLPTVSREPAVVLPGAGFYLHEVSAAGEEFNWLRRRGTLEVVADPSVSAVSVSAAVESAGERRRRLLVKPSGAGRRFTTVAHVAGPRQNVGLGTVRLKRGRGRILLRSSPGSSFVGADPRALSLRIIGLKATVIRRKGERRDQGGAPALRPRRRESTSR